jgi:biotin transport system substrate-specific component
MISFILTRTNLQNAALVIGCALLTVLVARVVTPLPYTPVPVTLQVAAVLFAGLVLPPRWAFVSQFTYLLMGLAGAPVFAFGYGGPAYLLNPHGTGGYLLSYPLAAWVVASVLAGAQREDRFAELRACAAGLAVIYAIGCAWLGWWLHLSLPVALLQGAGWFLFWDAAKALAVIFIARGLRRAVIRE